MANQKAILRVRNRQTGEVFGLRMTLVDADATASTFTDYGAATIYTAPAPLEVVGIVGQGTTAPATATAFQFKINANDVQAFVVGAAVFDPTSRQDERLVGVGSMPIPQGAAVQLIGRA